MKNNKMIKCLSALLVISLLACGCGKEIEVKNGSKVAVSAKGSKITATEYYDLYESDTSIYRTYIEPVVKGALNASFTQRVIITKGNDNITKVEDGKYYQTAKITVSGDPASELVSFDVEFKGVEGAFAVDAATGTKIESLSNIPKGTDFYVRVPVDKVSESLQELRIIVSGHFDTPNGTINLPIDRACEKLIEVIKEEFNS